MGELICATASETQALSINTNEKNNNSRQAKESNFERIGDGGEPSERTATPPPKSKRTFKNTYPKTNVLFFSPQFHPPKKKKKLFPGREAVLGTKSKISHSWGQYTILVDFLVFFLLFLNFFSFLILSFERGLLFNFFLWVTSCCIITHAYVPDPPFFSFHFFFWKNC